MLFNSRFLLLLLILFNIIRLVLMFGYGNLLWDFYWLLISGVVLVGEFAVG